MTSALDIVIVNWNSGDLLRRALAALAATQADRACIAQVIVVDNASTDSSCTIAPAQTTLPLTIIRNETNRGFAAACNQGAAAGAAEVILFLNPDVIVPDGALSAALRFLDSRERDRVGILGVQLLDETGRIQRSISRFPTPFGLLGQALGLDRIVPQLVPPAFSAAENHTTTCAVDQVMGAFLLIPRALFESLNGFDERFFVYYDDVDLCLRAKAAGWQVIHNAEVSAIHIGHGTTDRIKDIRLFYFLRSRLLYAAKHFGFLGMLATAFGTLAIEPFSRAAQALARGADRAEFAALLRGYLMLFRALPHLARDARREALPPAPRR